MLLGKLASGPEARRPKMGITGKFVGGLKGGDQQTSTYSYHLPRDLRVLFEPLCGDRGVSASAQQERELLTAEGAVMSCISFLRAYLHGQFAWGCFECPPSLIRAQVDHGKLASPPTLTGSMPF